MLLDDVNKTMQPAARSDHLGQVDRSGPQPFEFERILRSRFSPFNGTDREFFLTHIIGDFHVLPNKLDSCVHDPASSTNKSAVK